jgi:hypothetical protein
MKLSAEHKNQVHAWLLSKSPTGQMTCPVCQQTNWGIVDWLLSMLVVGEKPSIAIPIVSLACENCGHAQFFFAKTIGLDV